MDSNRCVELGLGRAALQRNGEALDYLARVSTHHVTADDTISLAIDDQLHEGKLVAAAEGMLQWTVFLRPAVSGVAGPILMRCSAALCVFNRRPSAGDA